VTIGDGVLDPAFAAACEADSAEAWFEVAELVAPNAYRLPLMRPEAAADLLADIDTARDEYRAACGRVVPPNSMHQHGAVLEDLDLGELCDAFLRGAVLPVSRHLFRDFHGDELDEHHGYLVEYGPNEDSELGFHVDDSDVTLNLCLGDGGADGRGFDGAELTLMGLRCELHRQTSVFNDEIVELDHLPGTAILHAGAHRHRVEPIRNGRRRNLILWCRASQRRKGPRKLACAPWCGMYAGTD